jgi:hypothetical protein
MLNTFPLCITAAAGTELAGERHFDISLFDKMPQGLQPKAFSYDFSVNKKSLSQASLIRLTPIVKDSSLLPQSWTDLVSVPLWPSPVKGGCGSRAWAAVTNPTT